MYTFTEYQQVRFLVTEMHVDEPTAKYLVNENFVTDWARRNYKRYGLPLAMVLAVLGSNGCTSKQSCPTPQVQQQIKQELKQELESKGIPSQQGVVDGEEDAQSTPRSTQRSDIVATPRNGPRNDVETAPAAPRNAPEAPATNAPEAPRAEVAGKQVAPDIVQMSNNKNTYRVQVPYMPSKLGTRHTDTRALNNAKVKLLKYLKVSDATLKHISPVDSPKGTATYEMTVVPQ